MSYNPNPQVPPQQGYPQQGYPQQGYAPPQAPAPAGGSLMQKLGTSGLITVAAGLVVLIAFFLPWLSADSPIFGLSDSFSGFYFAANAGAIASAGNGDPFGYILWFVPITALIMLGMPLLRANRKVGSGLTSTLVLTTAILCFLFELLIYAAWSSLGSTLGFSVSLGIGLYLTLLATLIGLVTYFFFRSSMKKKYPKAGQMANAYAQPGQFPGQQPPYAGQ